MINDALVNFVAPGAPLAITGGGAGASYASNIIDIIGAGVGQPPGNIIGTRTVFGSDLGVGWQRPQILATVGTAFATASGGTLNMQFQGATDSGAPGYTPVAWRTFMETGAIAVANLGANAQIRMDFPTNFPWGENLPRFLQLNFLTAASFTAGTIASAIVTLGRDDLSNLFAAKNFAVA